MYVNLIILYYAVRQHTAFDFLPKYEPEIQTANTEFTRTASFAFGATNVPLFSASCAQHPVSYSGLPIALDQHLSAIHWPSTVYEYMRWHHNGLSVDQRSGFIRKNIM